MAKEKWADYLISKVRYNQDRTHIDKVRVHEDKGDTVGRPTEWPRVNVVEKLDEGKKFVTILKNSDGDWTKGANVGTVRIGNKTYIRTDSNQTAADNLENLPEF